ncbi:hypothetical protein PanWU01x14_027100 [Parasponia andersonii]|uniref:Uncharacterized protein n=1 Tax=Parasponia andersonii TaxID=3476 RepID=A0A2P5DWA7_PARAD|nr:hypothetical protein PanWU01x14_027100 [Parasponia andersonii]
MKPLNIAESWWCCWCRLVELYIYKRTWSLEKGEGRRRTLNSGLHDLRFKSPHSRSRLGFHIFLNYYVTSEWLVLGDVA